MQQNAAFHQGLHWVLLALCRYRAPVMMTHKIVFSCLREYSVANSVDLDGVPHNAAFFGVLTC